MTTEPIDESTAQAAAGPEVTHLRDMPQYRELFEELDRFMKQEERRAARRVARERAKAEASGKTFFRLDPDASDEELLEVLLQIIAASSGTSDATGTSSETDEEEGSQG